ncbi:MAG: DUF721 domain-containing protein [Gammaproteobacteria bacterium]|nr:DUF721 domain-containing protein [Gammaproteobacteria bacterium]
MQKPKTKSVRSVKDILAAGPHAQLLAQSGLNNELLGLVRKQLSGPSSLHCVNAQLQHDTLIVHVDSPAWATKLRFQLGGLLANLRKVPSLNGLQQVQVRVLPGAEKKLLGSVPSSARLSEESAELIRNLASAISDDALRASWLRLAKNTKPQD